ncbi:hypothetical protein BB558_003330 [Smittium angustum]|uniref:Transmembrane protein 135 N-terminal domain-containing protein n=1 Tax=Smittium angustum TaxID=133377 RepID=A0A2U1J6A2_SMIAN|nr:hypothetical protein BB558_003330 [Smittium angustum]
MEGIIDTLLSNSFFETLVKFGSYSLTDKEKERVIERFKAFQVKLESLSSPNLQRLASEAESIKSQKPTCKHEGRGCVQNTIRGFIKAFVVGLGIRYAINVVPSIITLRIFKNPKILFSLFDKDGVQFAKFLSYLIGIYKGLLCALRNVRKDDSFGGDWVNSLVAAFVAASVATRADKNRNRQFTILLYVFTKTMQFLVTFGYNKWIENRAAKKHKKNLVRSKSESALGSRNSPFETEDQPGTSKKSKISGFMMTSVDSNKSKDKSGSGKTKPHDNEDEKDLVYYMDKTLRKFAPVLVMSAGCIVVVYIFLNESHILPRSYYGFLVRYSGLSEVHPEHPYDVLPVLSKITQDGLDPLGSLDTRILPGSTSVEKLASIPASSKFVKRMNQSIRHDWAMCAILHPSTASCTYAAARWMVITISRVIKAYLSLNIISTVVFKRKQLFKSPIQTIIKVLLSSLRSAAFFGTVVSIAVSVPCHIRNIFGSDHWLSYFINGAISGVSVMVEAEQRRLEMGMYVLMRGIELLWIKLLISKNKRSWPSVENNIFSGSFALLMMLYQNDPARINNVFRTVLTRIFGKN